MGELDQGPWIQQVGSKVGDAERTVMNNFIASRMLHESIRNENKITGSPTPQCNGHGSQKMITRAQSFLTPDQRTDKRAFQKKREHALHRERLANHATGIARKGGPIGSELKFHRNAGNNTDGKVDTEDFCPEPGCLVVLLFSGSIGLPFPINQKPRQPHRELRKQVMVNQRKTEVESVPKGSI